MSKWRRAAGTFRTARPRPPGGSGLRGGGRNGRGMSGDRYVIGIVVSRGGKQGVAPEQAHQYQVTMQSRPGASLVVAQPELLLAILMEALYRPAFMAEPGLTRQRSVVQSPDEKPRCAAGGTRHWALTQKPPLWSGDLPCARWPRTRHACRCDALPSPSRTVTVSHWSSATAAVSAAAVHNGATWTGWGCFVRGRPLCPWDPSGTAGTVPSCRGRPGRRPSGMGRAAATRTASGSRTPKVFPTCTT